MPTHITPHEDSFTDLDLEWERRFPTPNSEQEAIEDDIVHWQRIGQYVKNPPRMGYSRKLLIEHTDMAFSAICSYRSHRRCFDCVLNCTSSSSIYFKIIECLKNPEFHAKELLILIIQMIKFLKSELASVKN